ncbi:hypothetical protein MMC25_004895 [Agyrium rufum]|nr:hypothetical protein [Agyrium rufum]
MGQIGDLSPGGSVVFGVFVGLVSTSVQSLGLTLQRKSHILEDEKGPEEIRLPPWRRRRWQMGMLMFVVSNIVGSTIQITTLPLPVLSTLQASGLVFNSACATLILGEPFTRYSLAGTLLVSVGAVLIATFGAIGEPAHNLDQLLALLNRHQFIIWMIFQALLVLVIIGGASALKTLRPQTRNSPRMRLLRGMSYGGVSGILSAHSLLVAKSAVELLVRTIVDKKNQFNRWQSWVILLGLLTLALTQLYFLHRGLKLCSTSILYPFVFCIYNIIAILDGLIYFHQTDRLSLLSALLIALGTIILLLGVFALSWRLSDHERSGPITPKTPLTPGMGFLSDTSSTHSDSPRFSPTLPNDEESLLLPKRRSSMSNNTTPKPSKSVTYQTFEAPSTPHRTSTLRQNEILSSTRRARTHTVSEVNEIWNELEDESPIPTNVPSPWLSNRRSSLRNIPSRPGSAALIENDVPSSQAVSRNETAMQSSDSLASNGEGRSIMGRTYRDRRRSSMPFERTNDISAGQDDRPHSASRTRRPGRRKSANERGQNQKDEQQQDALGGWWKMRRWFNRRDSDKREDGEDGGASGSTS